MDIFILVAVGLATMCVFAIMLVIAWTMPMPTGLPAGVVRWLMTGAISLGAAICGAVVIDMVRDELR